MNRQNLTAAAIALTSALLCTSVHASSTYTLTGKLTGVLIKIDGCYISIRDQSRTTGYNNAWHITETEDICKFAQIAYTTGQTVELTNTVADGHTTPNKVSDIKATTETVRWPPYFS